MKRRTGVRLGALLVVAIASVVAATSATAAAAGRSRPSRSRARRATASRAGEVGRVHASTTTPTRPTERATGGAGARSSGRRCWSRKVGRRRPGLAWPRRSSARSDGPTAEPAGDLQRGGRSTVTPRTPRPATSRGRASSNAWFAISPAGKLVKRMPASVTPPASTPPPTGGRHPGPAADTTTARPNVSVERCTSHP